MADVIALADVSAIFIIILYLVADVIAIRKMFHHFLTHWQMLLPYDIEVDIHTTVVACYNSCLTGVVCQVADGIATCYNSCLAGVICQVADGIATVGWMGMVDGMSLGRWNSQGSV